MLWWADFTDPDTLTLTGDRIDVIVDKNAGIINFQAISDKPTLTTVDSWDVGYQTGTGGLRNTTVSYPREKAIVAIFRRVSSTGSTQELIFNDPSNFDFNLTGTWSGMSFSVKNDATGLPVQGDVFVPTDGWDIAILNCDEVSGGDDRFFTYFNSSTYIGITACAQISTGVPPLRLLYQGGDIMVAELIAYSKLLTGSDLTLLMRYMNNKYGTAYI